MNIIEFLTTNELLDLGSARLTDYLIDFGILFVLLLLLSMITKKVTGISTVKILAEDDNTAAGISYAGILLSLAIILSGASGGDAGDTTATEIMLMSSYGLLGIVFVFTTRYIHDKFMLPHVDLHSSIISGNVAASIASVTNLIASAIIIRGLMLWVDADTFTGLLAIFIGYFISQIMFYLLTKYRNKLISSTGRTIEAEIDEGNVGIALQYGGHRIGMAFAVVASTGLAVYVGSTFMDIIISLGAWLSIAIMLMLLQYLLSVILHKSMLSGIDTRKEIIEDNNVAVGMVEGTLFVVVGLILFGLFG